jgi:membrane protease YdiL (CAAX protease family)/LysM repeat protein
MVSNSWKPALIYLAAMVAAEVSLFLFSPLVGTALYGLILVAVLTHAALSSRHLEQRFLLALALAPLLRIIALILPLAGFPPVYRYVFIGVPLFIGVRLAAQASQVNRKMVGLTARGWPFQIYIGLTGIGLGYLQYLVLKPEPLISEPGWSHLALPALSLLVFTGLLEELIFRGMMQYAALSSLGKLGFLYVPALIAVLHLSSRSVMDALVTFGVAVFFGWIAVRSGSIVGVTLAHGLANIGLLLIFPFYTFQLPASSVPITDGIGGQAPSWESQVGSQMTPAFDEPSITAVQTEGGSGVFLATGEAVGTSTAAAATVTEAATTAQGEPTALPTSTLVPTTEPDTEPTQACGPPSGWVVYRVRPGDTLWSLSRALGIPLDRLRSANCLKGNSVIYAGQPLYVPFLPPLPLPTSTPRPVATATPLPPTATPPPVQPTLPPTDIPLPTETAPPPTDAPLPTNTTVPPTDPPAPAETIVPPTDPPAPTEPSPPPLDTPTLAPN